MGQKGGKNGRLFRLARKSQKLGKNAVFCQKYGPENEIGFVGPGGSARTKVRANCASVGAYVPFQETKTRNCIENAIANSPKLQFPRGKIAKLVFFDANF